MSTAIAPEYEYRTTDKSTWGDGAWESEPDKVQWTDAATGLPCLIVRGPSGSLCGYVGVNDDHPLYAWDYRTERPTDIPHECWSDSRTKHSPDCILSVHGGVTFSGMCRQGPEDRTICHIPQPGEPDHVFWFGFDCAHYLDLSPEWDIPSLRDGTYRDIAYVQSECTDLARQLAAIK